MHVVIVTEQDGKIILTKDELQKMLDDAFAKGYEEGKIAGQAYYIWQTVTPTWTGPYKDNVYLSNAVSNERDQRPCLK